MNNIFKKTSMISNKINENLKNTPSEIAKAKYYYNDFVKKMDKSDFCNTNRRYIAELAYVRRLKELYLQNNCSDLSEEMVEREDFILSKLKNEFGITFNE